MKDILLFVICAGVTAFIFKFMVGLITQGVVFVVMAIHGLRGKRLDLLLENHPMKCIAYLIILNTAIGAAYCTIIIATVIGFIKKGASIHPWAYIILSVAWGITIINGAEYFRIVLLSSCVLPIIFFYCGLYKYLLFLWLLISVISFAYYYGKVEVIKQKMGRMH
jgi:hypothetical protein